MSRDAYFAFGDSLTRCRRMRRMALAITEPVQLAVSELEWQFSRINSWLRDDQ